MGSVFIPTPTFPSVPQLPGVPQLARPIGALAASIPSIIQALLPKTTVGVLWHATKAAPVWGIFDSTGAQVISPDSIMDFGKRAEWRVPDYPIQQGQFASYNKVTVPYEIHVRMVKGSTLEERSQFENDCEFVAESLDLYTIITPERTYVGVNPIRLEFMRKERQGAFFIDCEMIFRAINQITPQYSSTTSAAASTANATNPAAVPSQNSGLVQPQPSTPLVDQILNGENSLFRSSYLPNPLGGS